MDGIITRPLHRPWYQKKKSDYKAHCYTCKQSVSDVSERVALLWLSDHTCRVKEVTKMARTKKEIDEAIEALESLVRNAEAWGEEQYGTYAKNTLDEVEHCKKILNKFITSD